MRSKRLHAGLSIGLFLGYQTLAYSSSALPAVADYKPDPNKVFRYAFEIAETSLDPHNCGTPT